MTPKSQAAYRTILPILIILLSIFNFFDEKTLYSLSSALSCIGVAGALLYIYYPGLSVKVMYAWIMLQIIVIEPYFDLTQTLKWTLGVYYNTPGAKTGLYINLFAIFMLISMRPVRISSRKGKKITFYEFRESALGDIFPLTGTITGVRRFFPDDYYTIVKPDTPFIYEGETVHHILVKPKDDLDLDLDPNGKDQIVYFRPVHKESGPTGNDVDAYPFVDWVYAGK